MANVKAVDTYRYSANLPLEYAGRLRTFLKGKRRPAREITGRGIRKPDRAMSASDFFTEVSMKALVDVHMDAESRKWVEKELEKNLEQRRKVVAENLAKRKPRDTWEKTGPKPGKVYPKFLAAMKTLAEERRARKGSAVKSESGPAGKKPPAKSGRKKSK